MNKTHITIPTEYISMDKIHPKHQWFNLPPSQLLEWNSMMWQVFLNDDDGNLDFSLDIWRFTFDRFNWNRKENYMILLPWSIIFPYLLVPSMFYHYVIFIQAPSRCFVICFKPFLFLPFTKTYNMGLELPVLCSGQHHPTYCKSPGYFQSTLQNPCCNINREHFN